MKLVLLAATALVATPVMAQVATGTAPTTTTDQAAPTGTSDPATQSDPTNPAGDPSMAPGSTMTGTPAPGTTSSDTMPQGSMSSGTMQGGGASGAMATSGDPVGGYQPSQPATTGGAQPGARVIFQQAQSPSQAYPAPAAQESYPICKRGQYDKCRQRGG